MKRRELARWQSGRICLEEISAVRSVKYEEYSVRTYITCVKLVGLTRRIGGGVTVEPSVKLENVGTRSLANLLNPGHGLLCQNLALLPPLYPLFGCTFDGFIPTACHVQLKAARPVESLSSTTNFFFLDWTALYQKLYPPSYPRPSARRILQTTITTLAKATA